MVTPKNYNKKRLTAQNIEEYLLEKWKAKKVSQLSSKKIDNITPLLQKDYGGELDCTLTSITTCIHYYTKEQHDVNIIYNYVEKVAKKYFYRGHLGTNPIFIKQIYDEVLKHFTNTKRKVSVGKLGKCLSFNFNTIKQAIDKNIPVIISIVDDGRNYYKSHSITIIGYATYKVDKQQVKVVMVYDNWSKVISYVDYDALSIMCCINY